MFDKLRLPELFIREDISAKGNRNVRSALQVHFPRTCILGMRNASWNGTRVIRRRQPNSISLKRFYVEND